jgi:hypothetical protein
MSAVSSNTPPVKPSQHQQHARKCRAQWLRNWQWRDQVDEGDHPGLR